MADINEVFDQLVLHYNTDTLLGNLAQALKRQAERDNDKRRKNVIRAEAKVVEELADQITAGEIPWPGESDSSVYARVASTAVRHARESQPKQFIENIARLKTEEDFGDNAPPTEDWISTLNELIGQAREIVKAGKSAQRRFDFQDPGL